MKNNKLKLVLKIVCMVLCAALMITGSVFIAAYVMQDDIDALKVKLDGAASDIADIKGKYEIVLQELDALESEQDQTKTDLADLSAVHKNTTEEIGKLIGEIDALKQAVNASDDELDGLKGELDAAKQEIESLKAELEVLKSKYEEPKIKIYIDQGHNPTGYYNAGASGNGYYEQDITFTVGKLLAERLKADGRFAVCLSRPFSTTVLGTDNDSSLDARVEGAKDFGADYFISLHTNAHDGDYATGFEILTIKTENEDVQTKDVSYRFGDYLRPYIAAATNLRDRGMKPRSDIRVLNNATMPAILIEMGFISNPTDASLMAEHPELFVDAIYEGMLSYFDLSAPTIGE